MRYLYINILFLCLLSGFSGFAQVNYLGGGANIAPASPEAASLGKYGDIPVSLHTGVPSISIPIYTLTEGTVSVPVSVSYHASGIRVEEIASSVGLGWALNAGGMISRTVQNAPDEGRPGATGTAYYRNYGHPLTPIDDQTDYSQYEAAAGSGYFDTEPDLFFFNVGGYAGKFFFDKTRKVHIVPQQDIQIEVNFTTTNGGSFDGFIFTDPQGVRYHFGATNASMNPIDYTETSASGDGFGLNLNLLVTRSGWYLSKIESADRKDIINLMYTTEKYGFHSPGGEVYIGSETQCMPTSGSSITAVKTIVEGKRLIAINGSNMSLTFTGGVAPREDLSKYSSNISTIAVNDEAKALKTIQVLDKSGNCMRKFEFAQSYVLAPAGTLTPDKLPVDDFDRKRLVLNSITESSCTNTGAKVHNFEYYDMASLPRRCDFSVDHWGYNNGKLNVRLMPGYPYTQTAGNAPCFTSPHDCAIANPGNAANREPSFPEMRHGTLKKITYPTGGHSVFDYEAHDSWQDEENCSRTDLITPLNVLGAVCPGATGTSSSPPSGTQFSTQDIQYGLIRLSLKKHPNCPSATIWLKIYPVGSSTWVDELVFSVNTNTERIEYYNLSARNLAVSTNYTFTLETQGLGPTATGGFANAQIYRIDRSTSQANKMVGGLRIKTITTSDGLTPNNIVKNYSYREFDTPGKSSGRLMSIPRYSNYVRSTAWVMSAGSSGNQENLPCIAGASYVNVFSSSTLKPMQTTMGSHIGYESVNVSETGKGKTRTTFDIPYYGANPPWGRNTVDDYPIAPPAYQPGLGNVLKEEHFNENNIRLYDKTYTYSRAAYSIGGNIDIMKLTIISPNTIECNYFYNGMFPPKKSVPFTYITLNTGYSVLDQTVERLFNSDGTTYQQKVQKFTYSIPNGHFQKTQEETTDSDGTIYRTKYKYAKDFACPTTGPCTTTNAELETIYQMRARNMVEIPIEQTNWIVRPGTTNALLTNATYFQFDKVNTDWNNIKLKAIQQVRSNIPMSNFTEMTVNGTTNTSLVKDAGYATEYNFQYSDQHGKLLGQWKQHDPAKQQYIWGHNLKLPTAKIINAESNEVAYTGFEEVGEAITKNGNWTINSPGGGWNSAAGNVAVGWNAFYIGNNKTIVANVPNGIYILSFWHKDGTISTNGTAQSTTTTAWKYHEARITVTGGSVTVTGSQGTTLIDELRLHPADAQMRTFSFIDNLSLLRSVADENSVPTFFDYDDQQRLQAARDQDRNIVQAYEYNYQVSGPARNDIKTRTVLTEFQTTLAQVNALTGSNVQRVVQYMDGLGRPIQTNAVGQSPLQRDIISYQVYDQYGREPIKYLPYTIATNSGAFRTNAPAEQTTFTNSFGAGNFGFAQTVFEASPMNRPTEQGAPGATWRTGQGANAHTMRYSWRTNNATDAVRNYANSTTYGDNTLWMTEETDENNRIRQTFTDKLGRTVLVRQPIGSETANTYTIYDDYGRVTAVLPPEATKLIGSNDWKNPTYANMIYLYQYDVRGRLVSKTVPSAGLTNIAYDRLDRPVLTTDAKGVKMFTRYDILSRPAVTGRYWGAAAPGLTEPLYETPSGAATYYTATSFPTDNNVHYYQSFVYDTYDLNANGTIDAATESYTNPGESGYATTAFSRVRGKAVATRTAVLPAIVTTASHVPSQYLIARTYYNKKYLVIQVNKQNHLGGQDVVSNGYDFANRLLRTKRSHIAVVNGTGHNHGIWEEYVYDHASRLRFVRHKVNTGNWVVTSAPLYDEMGRLRDKRLHASNYTNNAAININSSFNYLQSVDYTYNIRGWLTGINDVNNCTIEAGDNLADMFRMQLSYETTVGGGTAQYNGNISSIQWRSFVNNSCMEQQQYRFTYDEANRLKSADHYTNPSGSWVYTNNYSESNINYDLNGNIKTYTRRGLTSGTNTFGIIDQLTYSYTDPYRPDRLTQMADAGSGIKGFRHNSNATTPHYVYDDNGNIIQDKHKKLTTDYNFLNLPEKFTFANGNVITIQYDAAGNKLCKTTTGRNLPDIAREDRIGIPTGVYQALTTYSSQGTILSGSNVTFKSGESIVFEPGFSAEVGSTLTATIELPAIETVKQDYVGGIEYKGTALEAIYHGEGRYTPSGGYEYTIKDHLGNARINFRANGTAVTFLEENHYYPFGLKMEGIGTAPVTQNVYKYNSKELNNDFELGLYDYGARWYDPAVGRWAVVDPLAEGTINHSTYAYVLNNPISLIDPFGLSPSSYQANPNVGADGLTMDQWRESRGNQGMADQYRQQNQMAEHEANYSEKANFAIVYYVNAAKLSSNDLVSILTHAMDILAKKEKDKNGNDIEGSGNGIPRLTFIQVSLSDAKKHERTKPGEAFLAIVRGEDRNIPTDPGMSSIKKSDGSIAVYSTEPQYSYPGGGFRSYVNLGSRSISRHQNWQYAAGYTMAHELLHQFLGIAAASMNENGHLYFYHTRGGEDSLGTAGHDVKIPSGPSKNMRPAERIPPHFLQVLKEYYNF
jgi:RHS repeat-associated protein